MLRTSPFCSCEAVRDAGIGLAGGVEREVSRAVFAVGRGRDGSGIRANGNSQSRSPSTGRYPDTR